MKATLWLASLALVGVVACGDNNRTGEQTSRPATSPPATQSETAPDTPTSATEPSVAGLPAMSDADRALAQLVADALQKGAGGGSAEQSIHVHAHNGGITLRGSVNSEQDKADMEATAQHVAGVTSVKNQLEVASASRL
jgi:osmotically-inducible protein OsmY